MNPGRRVPSGSDTLAVSGGMSKGINGMALCWGVGELVGQLVGPKGGSGVSGGIIVRRP